MHMGNKPCKRMTSMQIIYVDTIERKPYNDAYMPDDHIIPHLYHTLTTINNPPPMHAHSS